MLFPAVGANGFLAGAAGRSPGKHACSCSSSELHGQATWPGKGVSVTRSPGKQRRDRPCFPDPACATGLPAQDPGKQSTRGPADFSLLNSVYIFHSSLFSPRCKPIPLCVCVSVDRAFGRAIWCFPDVYLRPVELSSNCAVERFKMRKIIQDI